MVFLPIEKTYGIHSVPDVKLWPFREMRFSNFGLRDLSAPAIHDFRKILENDNNLLL
jgi:hypothetical protein